MTGRGRRDGRKADDADDPIRLYGVDFSAAASDAGTKTWIASGHLTAGGGGLIIDTVLPLVDAVGLDTADRDAALPALADRIRGLDERAVVGLDFPFGLPRFIAEENGHESWRSVVEGFPESIGVSDKADGVDDADTTTDPVRAFAERCVELTERHGQGTYDKRETDAVVGARSPYGFIADTIAFYGIRDVLAPIAADVRFAPMDRDRDGGWNSGAPAGPTVLETYPAAVLDGLGLCRTNYKGSGDAERRRRRRNALGLTEAASVNYPSDAGIVDVAAENTSGDALDALAACVGTYRAWRRGFAVDIADFADPSVVEREGYIYA